MKKYFIVIAALTLLAACNSKKTTEPSLTEEKSVTETISEALSSLILPEVKDKLTKPINMRDSLNIDPEKGSVIQKKYKGTFPAADGPGIVYDLTLYSQQSGDEGVYEMKVTYLEAENGQDKTFSSTGSRKIKHGIPANSEAIVYELIPSDGSMSSYFLVEGDSLTLLNQELQKAESGLNYTLNSVP